MLKQNKLNVDDDEVQINRHPIIMICPIHPQESAEKMTASRKSFNLPGALLNRDNLLASSRVHLTMRS